MKTDDNHNYDKVASVLHERLRDIQGVSDIYGSLIDGLKGSIYIGKRKWFQGIGFSYDKDVLIVVVSAELCYGYQVNDLCRNIQQCVKEVVIDNFEDIDATHVEVRVVVENISEDTK